MATMAHHLLAKTTTDEILNNFKTGSWTYGASGVALQTSREIFADKIQK